MRKLGLQRDQRPHDRSHKHERVDDEAQDVLQVAIPGGDRGKKKAGSEREHGEVQQQQRKPEDRPANLQPGKSGIGRPDVHGKNGEGEKLHGEPDEIENTWAIGTTSLGK